MLSRRMLAVVLVLAGGAGVLAADLVGVPGSSVQYPSSIECPVAGRTVTMRITGTALRQKLYFNVYAVGSYVEEGAKVSSAEQLAAIDCPRRLHLVMERTVEGKDMAEAFRAAVRSNHPEPAFNEEVQALVAFMSGHRAEKGDHIYLTHVPGVGLECRLAGRAEFVIRNPAFSKAVWDIYLGKNNLGEGIKRGLTSRL